MKLVRYGEKGAEKPGLIDKSGQLRDLSARLRASGLIVPEERIWTSALATADFLKQQLPGGSAFVIGEAGILTALHEAGFIMTETNPDFVVVGETRNYSFEAITKAIRHIINGARFIVTNPDATGPSTDGPLPATGAIAALKVNWMNGMRRILDNAQSPYFTA